MHTIKLLLRLFAIESRDKNKNVPATLFKQRYQPTRFSNRSQNQPNFLSVSFLPET